MATRKMLALAVALGCLVVAFIAGSGSVATATQGQAVVAGAANGETASTVLCNINGITCSTTSNDGLAGVTNQSGGAGVYGDGLAYGVHGKAGASGWGVWGEGGDRGVYGVSSNEGVVGFGNSVGVRADSPTIALRVTGKVELSRSGIATIAGTSATPKSSVVVSGVALSSKSMVIVTVQKNVAGVWVRAAVPNVAGSSVTIYLNKAVTTSVPVAWMVIERP